MWGVGSQDRRVPQHPSPSLGSVSKTLGKRCRASAPRRQTPHFAFKDL